MKRDRYRFATDDMKNSLEIRAASIHEAAKVSELAMRSKAYWGYSESFMEACRDEMRVTGEDMDSAGFHCMVAERDSELLGYYAIEHQSDSDYELNALFVEPAYIGKGVGRALLDHAKQLTKTLGGNSLTIQGDPNAERFYLAAGGKPSGKRESGSVPGRYLPLFTIDLANGDVA